MSKFLREATGTGKSFGVAVGLASLVKQGEFKSVQSLYVAPNQELAFQIGSWIQQLTSHEKQVQILNEAGIRSTPHTVIGTPGQLLESIKQGDLPVHDLNRLVVDEVDRALSLPRRFAPVREQKLRVAHPKPTELLLDTLKKSRSRHQAILASATFNRPLRYFLKQRGYVRNSVFLNLGDGAATNTTRVKHHCLMVSDDLIRNIKEDKETVREQEKNVLDFDDVDDRMIESVVTLNEIEKVSKGILFINSSVSVDFIKNKLKGYQLRAKDIREYSPEHKDVLWIATEFSARGIDIPDISHVFILGRPISTTAYIHMAGRTGRLSPNGFNSGKVFSLVRNYGWTEAKMKNMYDLLSILY
ncbi:P-loop containing nucleoside triphosphate hydrolase protein [Sporodiniella umbellata]|nr:P-loop containing nucleoside triphosphate hydrolase protein [Sporodiniella umbellata]